MSRQPLAMDDAAFVAYVQRFRTFGYGRMMHLISELWKRSDPDGALSVGPCYGTLVQHRERCAQEGHDVSHGTSWDWCDRCGIRIDPETGVEAR